MGNIHCPLLLRPFFYHSISHFSLSHTLFFLLSLFLFFPHPTSLLPPHPTAPNYSTPTHNDNNNSYHNPLLRSRTSNPGEERIIGIVSTTLLLLQNLSSITPRSQHASYASKGAFPFRALSYFCENMTGPYPPTNWQCVCVRGCVVACSFVLHFARVRMFK